MKLHFMKKKKKSIVDDKKSIVIHSYLENKIYFIRKYRVMLDSDLAEIYGVTTKRLNEQVKRNLDRFPPDFMFVLTGKEFDILKSQIATSRWGGRRKLPIVFTEYGALMLASVLNSPVAIRGSIQVVRAFTYLKQIVENNKKVGKRLKELENRMNENSIDIKTLFEALKKLMSQPADIHRKIGFKQ